ncbi:MAG: 16S rRNA (guanine(966)-N(2))-methyltransferase RsmD [Lachnospiraceae bacterium]|nr:16S rRNA (guanine(966)-N(2))-methyltransferase RsmD [Lachnospiraceae bacterium]
MRVIAGKARSLRLKTVETMATRPTTDRIKETLFNMLQPYIRACRFLDLFAGSGGIGIEALSRGADKAVFADNNREAVKCIQDNLAFTRLAPQAEVYQSEAVFVLRSLEGKPPFDFIFMDPPYDKGLEQEVLTYLAQSSLMDEDTVVIVEASLQTEFAYLEDLQMELYKEKKYKTNKHAFIRRV